MNRRITTWSPTFFENLADSLLESTFNPKTYNYPPYNLVKTEKGQVLELAVSGFTVNDLKVSFENSVLVIEGAQKEDTREYAYKGLATRSFKNSFNLNSSYELDSVELSNGILSVSFIKKLEQKAKEIKIKEV